ncbi:MAG: glycosyltransferase family 4 protein [Acidimicrobiia bacterium]
MTALRTGINLMWLRPGVVGGTEEYACRLLNALSTHASPDDIELVLFALKAFGTAHADIASRWPTAYAPVTGKNRFARVAAESTWLGSRARNSHVDVVHHLGGTLPANTRKPSVVALHDLQYLAYPENFSLVKLAFLRESVPRAMRRAAVVTTLTNSVRIELIDRFSLLPDRVIVVPYALDAPTTPPDFDAPREPLFVYPVITYPHKNHLMLLRAFAQVVAAHPEARLVLTGGEGPSEQSVRDEIVRLRLEQAVDRKGRILRSDVDDLLARAAAIVFPSRYEGFGLGLLEGMRAGCAAIASNVTALPDVAGGAAVLLDPDDIDAWAAAMISMLDDPVARAGWARRGYERSCDFTAAESADRAVAAYRLAST